MYQHQQYQRARSAFMPIFKQFRHQRLHPNENSNLMYGDESQNVFVQRKESQADERKPAADCYLREIWKRKFG